MERRYMIFFIFVSLVSIRAPVMERQSSHLILLHFAIGFNPRSCDGATIANGFVIDAAY